MRADEVAARGAAVFAYGQAAAAHELLDAVGGDLGCDLAAAREPQPGDDLPRSGGRDGENRFSALGCHGSRLSWLRG